MNTIPGVNNKSVIQQNQRSPKNELGQDAFLEILAAQLQFQDPLSGGDNTEYVAQMAQFSSLEQMQNLNAGFTMMLYHQNVQYASELIGKNVTLHDGEQMIQGVVEKTKIANGNVNIVVDGKPYWLEQIMEIENVETTSEEGATQSDTELL